MLTSEILIAARALIATREMWATARHTNDIPRIRGAEALCALLLAGIGHGWSRTEVLVAFDAAIAKTQQDELSNLSFEAEDAGREP